MAPSDVGQQVDEVGLINRLVAVSWRSFMKLS